MREKKKDSHKANLLNSNLKRIFFNACRPDTYKFLFRI